MKRITSVAAILISLSIWTLPAESQILPFRNYSIELGLSESVAHTIMQDHQGYIWVGTGYGLNRFDGNRFRQYYMEDGLANNRVHSLLEDSKRMIWVGTEQGVSVLEADTLITPAVVQRLNRYAILDIFEDRHGNYWFGTDQAGLWRLDSMGQLVSINDLMDLPLVSVRSVAQDESGRIWVGSREGLVRICDDEVFHYSSATGYPDLQIRKLTIDEFGRIWIGTRTGLVRYEEGRVRQFGRDEGLADARIQTITVESYDRVWLGTESGISLFNGEEFKNFGREQGVPALIIYSSVMDFEGNIWFGTLGGGITLYTGDISSSFTIDNGLTNNVVTGFTEDDSGRIWIATYGGGVLRREEGGFVAYQEPEGLIDNKVYALYNDSEGRIWAGTREGISIYKNGRFESLSEAEFPFRVVRRIVEDPQNGAFWIGTYNDGLIYLDDEGFRQYNIASGFLHDTVMDIKQDRDGIWWFATYGGAAWFDGEEFGSLTIADGLPSNGVIHLHIDHEGNKWFSTFNGVARYNGETVEVIPELQQAEIISYFTLQDRLNRFWVGTNTGIFKINPDLLLRSDDRSERLAGIRLFNRNQGLIANELNAGASLLSSDGSLWLGTVEGLSHFFPERTRNNTRPPGITFEEVMISGREMNPERSYQVRHDRNFLQFTFNGLSYEAPDQIIYRYRLRGFDSDWNFTRENILRYPSLPAGEYLFEVYAYSADGVRSVDSASFLFRIMPPFYFQWWFILLIVLLLITMITLYLRYFRIRKQVDIERMRVQIASDLHDDVGSSLTELALQTDFLQAGDVNEEVRSTLRLLGEQSRKIVSSLDDIVWSIDSRNDTAGDLTDRMQDYVNQLFAVSSIEIHYHFDKLRMNEKLPVDVKENIYLIFKEAMNNIIKHSSASRIDIHFSFRGKRYELVVADNGTTKKSDRKSGQGLRNIKMRAERIGSRIDITDQNGFVVRAAGSIS